MEPDQGNISSNPVQLSTESEHALLDSLIYINFSDTEFVGRSLGDLAKELAKDDYNILHNLNNQGALYDLGISKDKPKGKESDDWKCSGNISEGTATAILNGVKRDPDLANLIIVDVEANGPGSRFMTLMNPDTKEIIIVSRGTGASEWIGNGEVIRNEEEQYLMDSVTKYGDSIINKLEKEGYNLNDYTFSMSGHSNGGLKTELLTYYFMAINNVRRKENGGKDLINFNGIYSMDGPHLSAKFMAQHPEITAKFKEMVKNGTYLRISTFNDFVTGLGSLEFKEKSTIFILPQFHDSAEKSKDLMLQAAELFKNLLMPGDASEFKYIGDIDARQHHSESLLELKYDPIAKEYYYEGIPGYTDGSKDGGVGRGQISFFIERLSYNLVIDCKDQNLSEILTYFAMGLMNKNDENTPSNRIIGTEDLMELILTGDNIGELYTVFVKSLQEAYAEAERLGETDTFFITFGELIPDKSVIESLLKLDVSDGKILTQRVTLDSIFLVFASVLQEQYNKALANGEDVDKLFELSLGPVGFFTQIPDDLNRLCLWLVNNIDVNNPPDDLGLLAISYLFHELNFAQERALSTKLPGFLSKGDGTLHTRVYILKQMLAGFYGHEKLLTSKEIQTKMAQIPEKTLKGTLKVSESINNAILDGKNITLTKPLCGPVNSPAVGIGFPSSRSSQVVVDYDELERAARKVDLLESEITRTLQKSNKLIRTLNNELGDKDLSSSERREIKSSITLIKKLTNKLDAADLSKTKKFFSNTASSFKDFDQEFARKMSNLKIN